MGYIRLDGQLLSTNGGGVAEYSAGANIDITDNVISGKDWTDEITAAGDSYKKRAESLNCSTVNNSYALGLGASATKEESFAEGLYTHASGAYSHAEGNNTKAIGNGAHSEGVSTTASGSYSHAEGYSTTAKDMASHAEGYETLANGSKAHAEGSETTASGSMSHAEGYKTLAGEYAHAEGNQTSAIGYISHAAGDHTLASGSYSTVIGSYNTTSNADKAFVIGNGTYEGAADAFVVDWEGNVSAAGYFYDRDGQKIDMSEKLDTTAFSTVSGTFLTAHQSLDGYLQDSDLGMHQTYTNLIKTISGKEIYASKAWADYNGNNITATYATKTELGNKLDTTAFGTVSGTFLTAHQSLSNYYKKTETSGASQISAALTAKQNALTNAQLSALSSVSSMYNMITAISASISAQWALSAGNGIAITNNDATKTSVISLA